jgi:hypothetical protein
MPNTGSSDPIRGLDDKTLFQRISEANPGWSPSKCWRRVHSLRASYVAISYADPTGDGATHRALAFGDMTKAQQIAHQKRHRDASRDGRHI